MIISYLLFIKKYFIKPSRYAVVFYLFVDKNIMRKIIKHILMFMFK